MPCASLALLHCSSCTLNELQTHTLGETEETELIWIALPVVSESLLSCRYFCMADWPNGCMMEKRGVWWLSALLYMPTGVLRVMGTELLLPAEICLARCPAASPLDTEHKMTPSRWPPFIFGLHFPRHFFNIHFNNISDRLHYHKGDLLSLPQPLKGAVTEPKIAFKADCTTATKCSHLYKVIIQYKKTV